MGFITWSTHCCEKSEYICKKDRVHKMRFFFFQYICGFLWLCSLWKVLLHILNFPQLPEFCSAVIAGQGTRGTTCKHFRGELFNQSYVHLPSGFVFHFLTSSAVQERYNIRVEPLVSVCFIRKFHSKISQSINQSINPSLSHWLYFIDFIFISYFSSLDLLNTIILLATLEEFYYHFFKIRDVIIL